MSERREDTTGMPAMPGPPVWQATGGPPSLRAVWGPAAVLWLIGGLPFAVIGRWIAFVGVTIVLTILVVLVRLPALHRGSVLVTDTQVIVRSHRRERRIDRASVVCVARTPGPEGPSGVVYRDSRDRRQVETVQTGIPLPELAEVLGVAYRGPLGTWDQDWLVVNLALMGGVTAFVVGVGAIWLGRWPLGAVLSAAGVVVSIWGSRRFWHAGGRNPPR